MHIKKYMLGLLLFQGFCLGAPNKNKKNIRKEEILQRLQQKISRRSGYPLKNINPNQQDTDQQSNFVASNSDRQVESYSQPPRWVVVLLSKKSCEVLARALQMVKEAKYPVYRGNQLSRKGSTELTYDGVLIQDKNPLKNKKIEDLEFKNYCEENKHANEVFGTNLPIE